MKNNSENILSLLFKLCSIPSITGEKEEDGVPLFLKEELSGWEYFGKHPQNIWLEPLEGDKLKRHNFCAIVRAEPAVKRTIILMSHHDVVPVDNCKPVNASPFDIAAYTKAIEGADTDVEAEEDLKSGNWLFGRGVSDMKSGMAAQIALLAELAEKPESLSANILLMTMADEENNGFGVHQAVRMLVRMQEQEGLEYIACIDSEPTITNENKECGRIYAGTIGNATLFSMCVGKSSHVGEYFSGINSTLIMSQLISEVESDPETSDEWMGKRYSPATCLQAEDLCKIYSVTLPEKSAALFNVLMTVKTPAEQMKYLEKKAYSSLNKTLSTLSERMEVLRGQGYVGLPGIEYKARVIMYSELENIVKAKVADLLPLQQSFMDSLPEDMSSQDRGIALAEYMTQLAGVEGPYVLIGYLSYCQPRVNRRRTEGEKKVVSAMDSVIKHAQDNYGHKLLKEEIYEGISDMSELGYQGTDEDLRIVTGNFIGWGTDFNYPFDEMRRLDVPIVNLGPIGKDAHKLTERLDKSFYTNELPGLLKKLVMELISLQ